MKQIATSIPIGLRNGDETHIIILMMKFIKHQGTPSIIRIPAYFPDRGRIVLYSVQNEVRRYVATCCCPVGGNII